jgi:hypothetical protein
MDQVKEHLPAYKKNDATLYSELADKTQTAIDNAKLCHEQATKAEPTKQDWELAGISTVYRLVETLLPQ